MNCSDYLSQFNAHDRTHKHHITWYDFCHRVAKYPEMNIGKNTMYTFNFKQVYGLSKTPENTQAIINTTKVSIKCLTPKSKTLIVVLDKKQYLLEMKEKEINTIHDVIQNVMISLTRKFRQITVFTDVNHISIFNAFVDDNVCKIDLNILINFDKWKSWPYVKVNSFLFPHRNSECETFIDFTHVKSICAKKVRSINNMWFLEHMEKIHTLCLVHPQIKNTKDVLHGNKIITNLFIQTNRVEDFDNFTANNSLRDDRKFVSLSFGLTYKKTLFKYLESLKNDCDQLEYLTIHISSSIQTMEPLMKLFTQIFTLQNIKELIIKKCLVFDPKLFDWSEHPTLNTVVYQFVDHTQQIQNFKYNQRFLDFI